MSSQSQVVVGDVVVVVDDDDDVSCRVASPSAAISVLPDCPVSGFDNERPHANWSDTLCSMLRTVAATVVNIS